MEKENKPAIDFEAFRNQAATRLNKGENLLDTYFGRVKHFISVY